MVEQKEQKQIQLDIKRVIPIFADNVVVANLIKAQTITQNKGKSKNNLKKEGHVTLIFIDSLTHQAVSRVVVSRQTAESLLKALDESLKKFDKEMKSKEIKSKAETIATEKKAKYLG